MVCLTLCETILDWYIFYIFEGAKNKTQITTKLMKTKLFFILLMAAIIVSCGDSSPTNDSKETAVDQFAGLQEQAQALFGTLPLIAENIANPITDEKVQLGKKLYFDNRLSKDNTQSCNTCHNVETYGVDNEPTSKGDNGGLGTRNSPTTFNAAFHTTQFWDGREPDVEAQAGGPILNPVEMAMPDEASVVNRLKGIEEYVTYFAKSFPDEKDPITYNNLKLAIGAYERMLVTPTKFDDYLAGNTDALNTQEKEGLQTFITGGCITCHRGNVLGGNMFQKFGLMKPYWEFTKSTVIDDGKFEVTQNEADKYVFKVPSLRNIEKTYPYFHDGSIMDLREATDIMGKTQLNKTFTDKELDDMVVFMNTLTGEIPDNLKE
ncbi:MAG: c-type cytochrome [Bacteroidales bacterium]|nr:c-type cytochrome [Bacteroidales bacterium]